MRKWQKELIDKDLVRLEEAKKERAEASHRTPFFKAAAELLSEIRQENNFGPRLRKAFKAL